MMIHFAHFLGVFVIAAIGFLGLAIAAHQQHWCSYGRETLAWFGVYQIGFVTTRVLVWSGALDRELAFIVNTIMASVFLSILINLVALHVMWHRSGLAKGDGQHASEGNPRRPQQQSVDSHR